MCQVAKRKVLGRPCYDVVFAIVVQANINWTKKQNSKVLVRVLKSSHGTIRNFRESAAKGSGSRLDWGGSLSAGLDPSAGEG